MKTTLDLNDQLLADARALAAQQRNTLTRRDFRRLLTRSQFTLLVAVEAHRTADAPRPHLPELASVADVRA